MEKSTLVKKCVYCVDRHNSLYKCACIVFFYDV